MMSPTGLSSRPLLVVVLLLALVWDVECQTCTTTGGTQATGTCVFPFTYNGVTYTTCTTVANSGSAWCSVTNNYPVDRRWGNCDNPTCGQSTTTLATPTCPVPTTGGNANGANCVFPFQFQNSLNYNCRVGGVSSTPWCATTANWDNDGQWGNCIIYSTRLSSSGASLPCVFPFTYSGSTYYECQLSSQSNLLWCGVVSMVSTTDTTTWGYCQTNGVCAATTTPTQPTTGTMQTNCPGATATTGGNGGGANCVFPFTYSGVSYTTCITNGNGNTPWCATTNNYPSDRRWGNCLACTAATTTPVTTPQTTPTTPQQTTQPTTPPLTTAPATTPGATTPVTTPAATTPVTTPAATTPVTTPAGTTRFTCASGVATVPTTGGNAGGAPCHFPFIYRSQSYDACITTGNSGVLWCATVPNYDNNKTWGNCGTITCVTATTPSAITPGATTPSQGTPTVTPPSLCPIMTTGGTGGGANCVFPFTYNNQPQYTCITDNYSKPWCGTSVNYDQDRRWGECLISTTVGGRCVFPFVYKGVSHNECTTVDQNARWCATVANLVSLTNTNQWGFCSEPMEPNCPTLTTTGSTPVVTGGCVDSFQEVRQTLSFGGSFQQGIITQDACRTACLARSDCLAFDYNIQNVCFIHTQPNYIQMAQSNRPNVNQYRRVPCLTTSTPATTQPGSTPVCRDTFQSFARTNSFSGMQNSATTLAACENSCLADSQCRAFDYTTGNKCFIHYDGYLSRLGTQTVSTQYRRIPCDVSTVTTAGPVTSPACPITYNKLEKTLALGGTLSSSSMTVPTCEAQCTAMGDTCIAFDFNRNKNLCYFHANLNDVITGPDVVDQYRKVTSCVSDTTVAGGGTSPTGCVDTFTKRDRTFMFGGTEILNNNNLGACQATCLAQATCVAVDYNRLNMKCFSHTTASFTNPRTGANIDQYVRQRCAATTVVQTTVAGGTPTGCIDSFNKFGNTLSLSGQDRGTVTDVAACQAICLADATCAGFDYNRATKKCFTHTTTTLAMVGQASPANIDQYRRVYCASTTVTQTAIVGGTATTRAATTACDPFLLVPGTASQGGTEITGPNTVAACKADCAADAQCVGFDFNTNQNKCYRHISTSAWSTTRQATAVNQYRKTGTCQGPSSTAAPPAATTATVAPGAGTTTSMCDTFTRVVNTMSSSGTTVNAPSVAACMSACMNRVNCAAFDFRTSGNQCILHAMDFMDNVQGGSGIDQYRRIFCP